MRLLTILLVLMVFCSSAWSQERDDGALHIPDAKDYLQAFVEEGDDPPLNEPVSPFVFGAVPETYSEALFYLYPNIDETPLVDLYEAYTVAQVGQHDIFARAEWVRRMVEAWITENNVDLSVTNEMTFEDFFIDVIPRDFNADGVDEYLLDISKGVRVNRRIETCLQADVSDYLIVQPTSDGYRFVETGLPWKGYPTHGRYSYGNGGMYEMRFEDLTADGMPEWVIMVGGETAGGPGMGYSDGGGLIVLNWHSDGFQYIVPTTYDETFDRSETTTSFWDIEARCNTPFPITVEYDFADIDGDAPLEILQAQKFTDNWSCTRTETQLFDWSAADAGFHYATTSIDFENDTQNCVQKDAEGLMWEGDYEAAISIYEHALDLTTDDLTPGESNFINYERSLNQYLRARLAFAYLMTGQQQHAEPILDVLAEEAPEEETIGLYIEALNNALHSGSTPIQICSAVYTLFASNFIQIRAGYTGDDLYYYDNPYLPERIGCDAPFLLQTTLNDARISTEANPVDVLTEIGIGVARELEIDLDGDGQSEWIVWADVPGMELSFVPNGDAYDVSLTEIDRLFSTSDMAVITLPDGWGSAIATIRSSSYDFLPWTAGYSPFGGPGGGPAPTCSGESDNFVPVTWLQLWRWEGGIIERFFSRNVCGATIADVFPENGVINAFTLAYPECIDYECNRSQVIRSDFRWDESQSTYVQAQAAAEVTPTVISPTETPRPYPQYYSVLRAFEARDFEAVVVMTAPSIEIDPERDVTVQLSN